MKKATLSVGLQSEIEDWYTSSSTAEPIPRDRIRDVSLWAFEEGCRRLMSGGSAGSRKVTLAVSAHANLVRILDEQADVSTLFIPDDARAMMEHVFNEALRLIARSLP